MIDRVEVTRGSGTVIRYGGIVAWAAPSASPALISFLAQSARNLGPSPLGGHQIAGHIGDVLSDRDPEPNVAFAVVGPSEQGWEALLHGPVQVWDGARWVAPNPKPGWLQAAIDPQPAITVGSAGAPTPALVPDTVWDLEAGVVPGAGFVLVPTVAASYGPSSTPVSGAHLRTATGPRNEPTTVLVVPDPTAVLPVVGGDRRPGPDLEPEPDPDSPRSRPPQGSLNLLAVRAEGAGATRPALPVGRGPDRSVPGAPVVAGVLCARGHLNRPGMPACVRCSTPIPFEASYTVTGTRPALGALVADDATVYRLDRGYVVGSDPSRDPAVRSGQALPLILKGADIATSHADVRTHDWDVVVTDRGSASGTCIFELNSPNWLRLRPYEPRVLRPGTHVAFAQRIVTFVTPWVVPDAAVPQGDPQET
jgi:hypothetical protein